MQIRVFIISCATACAEPPAPESDPQMHDVWIVTELRDTECHDHIYSGGSTKLERSAGELVRWQLDFHCGSGERQIKFIDPIIPVADCVISPEQPFDMTGTFYVPNGETAYITCGVSGDAATDHAYAYRILDSAPLDPPPRLRHHTLEIEVVP